MSDREVGEELYPRTEPLLLGRHGIIVYEK
jgi:hypothetical protein